MLGSSAGAEDPSRTPGCDGAGRTPAGSATPAAGRVRPDLLRSRAARREQSLDETFVPDPVIGPLPRTDPERPARLEVPDDGA